MRSIALGSITPGSVSAAEAASIALTLAHQSPLPGDALLAQLSADGSIAYPLVTHPAITDDVDALGRLLSSLLALDDDSERPAGTIPGPLMVAIARARRAIDLPPLTLPSFIQTLERYGSADPEVLQALYLRLTGEAIESPLPALKMTPGLRWIGQTAIGTAVGFGLAWFLVQPPPVLAPPTPAHRPIAPPTLAPVPTEPARESSRTREDQDPVTSRAPVSLGASRDAFSPSFASGGRELLFHLGRERAPIVRASLSADGRVGTVRAVLNDGFANYHPVLSPDGRWIAFDSDREGTRAVFIVAAAGGEPKKISGPFRAAVPSWSPDGTRIAYVEDDWYGPRAAQIWVADIESGERRQVTSHRLGTPWRASWFPDGRRIAYSLETQLIVEDVDSPRRVRQFSSPKPGRLVRTPAVSPDGREIVFQVMRDGVWLLDVATGNMRKVLDDPLAEEFAWTPRGDAVAFHTRRGTTWSLWSLPVS